MNNVSIIGRLVAEPELKNTNSGVEVLSFTLAVDRNYQKKGEDKQCDFIDCQAWRTTAAFISKYFHKGSLIAVTGEIQTRTYEDKNGNKRKATEVVVDHAFFCGGKSDSNSTASAEPDEVGGDIEEIKTEDLPF